MAKKILWYTVMSICTIFVIWVFASWINVTAHNLSDQNYSPWNFFYHVLHFGDFLHSHSFGMFNVFIN